MQRQCESAVALSLRLVTPNSEVSHTNAPNTFTSSLRAIPLQRESVAISVSISCEIASVVLLTRNDVGIQSRRGRDLFCLIKREAGEGDDRLCLRCKGLVVFEKFAFLGFENLEH